MKDLSPHHFASSVSLIFVSHIPTKNDQNEKTDSYPFHLPFLSFVSLSVFFAFSSQVHVCQTEITRFYMNKKKRQMYHS